MTRHINIIILIGLAIANLLACSPDQSASTQEAEAQNNGNDTSQTYNDAVHLSSEQFDALGLEIDSLKKKNLSTFVEANGQLEVPPQNEASVTAVIGANVTKINVIEGDEIKKGQVLAWLSHPDLIKLQTGYAELCHQMEYLNAEYKRQKRLYDEEVGSGKDYQKTRSDYLSAKSRVEGMAAQLELLGLNTESIRNGKIYKRIPVVSPIPGSIRLVEIKTGQYVNPQQVMFEIVNTHHVHADLMVFEKDAHKVVVGQKVLFNVESLPGETLEASIYAVGKSFEQDPKALHIHAEINNKKGNLIPGMYIKGKVMVDEYKTYALPEEAIVREGEKYYAFLVIQKADQQSGKWTFTPFEVTTGVTHDGWTEVRPMKAITSDMMFLMNNAYYLLAEMNKGEGGGHHH